MLLFHFTWCLMHCGTRYLAAIQQDQSSTVDKKASGSHLGDHYRILYFPLVRECICILGSMACQPIQYAYTLSPRTRVEKIPLPSFSMWKSFIDRRFFFFIKDDCWYHLFGLFVFMVIDQVRHM